MTFEELQQGLRDFKHQQNVFRTQASTIGALFREVIRQVDGYALADIKRELRNFDSVQRRWKA